MARKKEKRELRRMSRVELIEIIYQLQQDLLRVQEEKDALEAKLEDRRIRLSKARSIAEAALNLNGVYAAAQAVADQYIASIRTMYSDDSAALVEPDLTEDTAPETDTATETDTAPETETDTAPDTDPADAGGDTE